MKKIDKVLLITAITCAILWITAFVVCAQVPKFSDSLMFRSFYNETQYGEKRTHQPEVTFRFEGDLMITTMQDQMSRFRSYGIIQKCEDQDHIWETHQCLDNSGTRVNISLAYEKPSDTQIIIVDYGDTRFWFEVDGETIPAEVRDIMDDIEALGNINDGNFGANYTDEQVHEFLSQFGNSSVILNMMLRELFFNENFGVNNKPQKWQK